VCGIVLPLVSAVNAVAPLNVVPITTVDIRVAVEVVIVVDVDVVAAPTTAPAPTATPGSADRHADPKRDRTRRNHGSGRIWWIVNRWIGINRRTVHDSRVVRRHIDHLRIRLFDHDHLLIRNGLCFDVLLLVVGQRSTALRFCAHALNGVHHIALLRQKRIAEIRGPLNIIRQTFHYVGQRSHCLNARIPGLFLDCFR
jgi:hypothetical protein